MSCLIVLSFMSCSISLSFHGCLITLALVVFWVRQMPQECTTFRPLTLLVVPICTRYFVPFPWHVHWHIISVISFYFNFGSNLIIFVLVEAYSLVARAVPLSFIFICSCSRKLYLRLRSLTRIPTRLGY